MLFASGECFCQDKRDGKASKPVKGGLRLLGVLGTILLVLAVSVAVLACGSPQPWLEPPRYFLRCAAGGSGNRAYYPRRCVTGGFTVLHRDQSTRKPAYSFHTMMRRIYLMATTSRCVSICPPHQGATFPGGAGRHRGVQEVRVKMRAPCTRSSLAFSGVEWCQQMIYEPSSSLTYISLKLWPTQSSSLDTTSSKHTLRRLSRQ